MLDQIMSWVEKKTIHLTQQKFNSAYVTEKKMQSNEYYHIANLPQGPWTQQTFYVPGLICRIVTVLCGVRYITINPVDNAWPARPPAGITPSY